MRTILALTAAMLTLGVCNAQLLEPQKSPATVPAVSTGPRISFDNYEYDFGEIFDDQRQIAYFPFRNVGQQRLVIRQVKTTCGCTSPKLEKTEYEPGETGQIEVHFNPARKSGRVRQRITVISNDSQQDQIQLNLNTTVIRRVIIDPPVINFHQAGRSQKTTKILTIAGRGEGFKIEKLSFANPNLFEAKILGDKMVEIDGDQRRQYEVEITLLDSAPIGRSTTQLEITTNERIADKGNAPTIVVTCSANIAGDLIATPTRIQLRNLKPNAPFTAQVRLTHRNRVPFTIVEAVVTDQGGGEPPEILIKPIGDSAYRIVINGKTQDGARYVRGTLDIKTDIPGEEIKKINYYGNILRQ